MNRNVGTLDRILRVIVGVILIALVFVGPKTAWGWIGVIPLATAFIGFCPAYRLLGICTSANKSKQA
jgi:ABC-type polysaccharide/polyol phosphate export permease